MTSCQMPKLDGYIVPVLSALPASDGQLCAPAIDAFFNEEGKIISIVENPDAAPHFEALKSCLGMMRFIPAQCYDEAVVGHARVRFDGFFVLQKSNDSPSTEMQAPIFRVNLSERTRSTLSSAAELLGIPWLVAHLQIDEAGKITKLTSENSDVASYLFKFFGAVGTEQPFVPAVHNGTQISSEVDFYWKAHGPIRSQEVALAAGSEALFTPLPDWPEDWVLEKDLVCGMTLFVGPDHSISGMYIHPDVPKALRSRS